MKKLFKIKKQLLLALLLLSVFICLIKNHLIINITNSMPKGIYIQQKKLNVENGDIVAVCLPNELKHFALQRKYITKGIYCSGAAPLIKKIIAMPGDNIEVNDHMIQVNNESTYPIKIFKSDSHGRQLFACSNGTHRANGYWLLGVNNERSWDSRYFGEINSSNILCVLRPIFVW